jgi:hypothetical protein
MVPPARHQHGQETALTPSGILGIRSDSLRHFGASGIEEARFPRSSVTDPISLNP